jgi:hypothetical protein
MKNCSNPINFCVVFANPRSKWIALEKGRSKNCVKWCKNSGKSNSAKQLLFQLDADELKKELVLTKNSTSKKKRSRNHPNVSGVLENFGFGSL